ncbi:hypothetical protein [Massilia sp. TS11]|uniref:hypothetical protein n=1 Tax=Massilia sp. TS11 TaxID=2908003 RepID=UPI001EDB33A4|nr:hypothetical protein [Massilia sp. TS11]MCG2583644.1 hypothetical protein [Massilia sp. TS11]
MAYRFSPGAAAALFCIALSAQAASLTPYQQAALNKMLAQVPAEQRAMVRPQLEAMVSRLGKAEIDMMMAKMNESQKQESPPEASGGGEWGKAEADYAAAFPKVQAYIAHVAEAHDRMLARWNQTLNTLRAEFEQKRSNSFVDNNTLESCERALNLVPQGRARMPQLAENNAEQDRILTRILVENRANYASPEAYAKMIGQKVDSEMMQAVRYHWSAPMPENEVLARLGKIETDMLSLLEANTRELHRIYQTPYPDQMSGGVSKMLERDLEAHRNKGSKAATALCAPGYEAYTRGLIQYLAPVAAKLKH